MAGKHIQRVERYILIVVTMAMSLAATPRPAPAALKITELNYNPYPPSPAEIAAGYTADDFEFIELRNVSDTPISTMGLAFDEGVQYAFGETTLLAGERIILVRNIDAFGMRRPGFPATGVYTGSLDNGGETLALIDVSGREIHAFTYDDSSDWPGRADGKGASLEVIDTAGDYDDPANWRSSGEFGGTLMWTGAGILGDVVVNEVLSHTDFPQSDSIELHNTTDAPIDIGGWYLSDTHKNYLKFRIPDGTTIAAGGYVVFDEYDFNATGLTPSTADDDPNDFGLNGAEGDDLWLMAANAGGVLERFVDHVQFRASFNGVPFGRYPNGSGELTSLQTLTLGDPNNDDPIIASVIISEIMYHSDPPSGVDEDDLEFIELYNRTDVTVPLDWFDANGNGVPGIGETAPWRLQGGVEFDFPTGASIAPGGTLLIVDFQLTNTDKLNDFMDAYDLSGLIPGVHILGGWSGQLSNSGETIRLLTPDTPPTGETFHPYIVADAVAFSDQAPWPIGADGTGASLQRIGEVFGNDPANWIAETPTPGSFEPAPDGLAADFDDNGVVDLEDFVILKTHFGQSPVTKAQGDADGDGAVTLEDFVILKSTFGSTAAAAAGAAMSVAANAEASAGD